MVLTIYSLMWCFSVNDRGLLRDHIARTRLTSGSQYCCFGNNSRRFLSQNVFEVLSCPPIVSRTPTLYRAVEPQLHLYTAWPTIFFDTFSRILSLEEINRQVQAFLLHQMTPYKLPFLLADSREKTTSLAANPSRHEACSNARLDN